MTFSALWRLVVGTCRSCEPNVMLLVSFSISYFLPRDSLASLQRKCRNCTKLLRLSLKR